jgi:hypothetical protein
VISSYERHTQPLAPRHVFYRRLAHHGALAGALVTISLAIGTAGYYWLAHQSMIDSFLNASMLLGGMGPVGELTTTEGKLFASFYALYAGLVFISLSGIVLLPVIHRLIHHFHVKVDRT